MSEWDYAPTAPSREFLVSLDLYVSNTASAGLRKPPNQRKRNDKRDSKQTASMAGDDIKKIREKSSWLSLAKGPSAAGYWRSATCRLGQDGERCLLSIYLDESILYQKLNIHLLHHTDIRHADMSLHSRKYCLGIYCQEAAQRWCSAENTEPVFLSFTTQDACNTWLVLLRSYAIPEIYGKMYFPKDGGSYRMWRQVELTVMQGRNLGNTKPFEVLQQGESNSELDPVDLDVACEISMNNIICGRTTIKKGIGSPDWHEAFTFADLPPFDNLDITVIREKKVLKTSVLGVVRIALSHFRRGETVEGWFPVLQAGMAASDIQVGDIRLKIRVDEEIILPYHAYTKLLKTFTSRNFLDWMTDFENKLKLKSVAPQLIYIATANNYLFDHIQEIASREVDGTPSSHQTLFRGNTPLTKIMEICMKWYGEAFLEASIGQVLRRLCYEKVAIEVDPIRNVKGTRDLEKNVDSLVYWCQEFWNQIYSARGECPHEIRKLFEIVRKLVEKRYQGSNPMQESQELPWQSVSAFCFLRFIVPAILHPHLFGLCPGLPSVPVQRSLTLIAKVMQSLANLSSSVQKEEFMRGVKEFLQGGRQAMIDYLLVVSTPSAENHGLVPAGEDQHDRLRIANSLRERANAKPALDREATPILPHLLDIPRHLAIITSAVIRHSRDYLTKQHRIDPEAAAKDGALNEICSRCYDVEEQALQRVNFLATRIRNPGTGGSETQPSDYSDNLASQPDKRSRKAGRPSTAPSPSPDARFREPNGASSSKGDISVGSSGSQEPPSPTQQTRQRSRLVHIKSTSTDSMPSYDLNASVVGGPLLRTETSLDILDEEQKPRKGFFPRIWKR